MDIFNRRTTKPTNSGIAGEVIFYDGTDFTDEFVAGKGLYYSNGSNWIFMFSTTSQPKSYRAVLNQSGTNAPTADIVFENQLEDAPVFYYENVGIYRMASNDFLNYSDDKVWVMIGPANQNNSALHIDAYTTTAPIARDPLTEKCEIALETTNSGLYANDMIYQVAIHVLVYP